MLFRNLFLILALIFFGALCRTAEQASPFSDEDEYVDAAIAGIRRGESAAAIEILEAAKEQWVPSARACYVEVYALDELGRVDAALTRALECVENHPDNFAIHRIVAYLHMANGRQDRARFHARRAVELAPENPEVRATLATVAGTDEAARAEWNTALALAGTRPHLRESAGRFFASIADHERAAEIMCELHRQHPGRARYARECGYALYHSEDYRGARSPLALAFDATRDWLVGLLLLDAHIRTEDWHAARTLAQSLDEMRSGQTRVLIACGISNLKLQNYAESHHCFELAESHSASQELKRRIRVWRGNLAMAQNNPRLALQFYEAALMQDDQDATTHWNAGHARSALADEEAAMTHYQRACDLGLLIACEALQ